jgi:retron-type reverse transcriptase
VKANKGAPGVDRQDFEYIEEVIGVDQFLLEVREQLKSERYKPQPVLRCYIEKPGKAEKRPLGIPVIFDRVCQMATKLVIEPIFEANFLDCSHGFRPGRSAHDAIRIISRAITFKGQRIVVDADIVGFLEPSSYCTPFHERFKKRLRWLFNTLIYNPICFPLRT